MKRALLALVGMLLLVPSAHAGCIGPTIMGKCEGAVVEFDTHRDGRIRPNPPPGFYYDKRGTEDERQNPGAIDPFTGRDANDSNWSGEPQRERVR